MNSFRFVSFRFVSFRFVSFRFVSSRRVITPSQQPEARVVNAFSPLGFNRANAVVGSLLRYAWKWKRFLKVSAH